MTTKSAALALALAFALVTGAVAREPAYAPRTGDNWVDAELVRANGYGRDERAGFVDDLVDRFGAPRYLVNELLDARRWSPGDVYYACALAYQARRPCGDVARAFEQDKAKGWSAVAKGLGITPGSAAFHALKGRLGPAKKGEPKKAGDDKPPPDEAAGGKDEKG
jgi:hypothetical protein